MDPLEMPMLHLSIQDIERCYLFRNDKAQNLNVTICHYRKQLNVTSSRYGCPKHFQCYLLLYGKQRDVTFSKIKTSAIFNGSPRNDHVTPWMPQNFQCYHRFLMHPLEMTMTMSPEFECYLLPLCVLLRTVITQNAICPFSYITPCSWNIFSVGGIMIPNLDRCLLKHFVNHNLLHVIS